MAELTIRLVFSLAIVAAPVLFSRTLRSQPAMFCALNEGMLISSACTFAQARPASSANGAAQAVGIRSMESSVL